MRPPLRRVLHSGEAPWGRPRPGARPLACALALLLAPCLASAALAAEDLVPGSPSPRTDPLGVTWTPDEHARVTTPLGWAISATQYNQATFTMQQQRMRRDGSESVLDGAAGNLLVQRRVAHDARRGGIRIVDVLRNETPAAQTLQLNYWSQFNTAWSRLALPSGGSVVGELPAGETGVIGYLATTPATAVLYAVCSPDGGLRPTVQMHGNQNLQISYTVIVPAGGSVAIALGMRILTGVQAAGVAGTELASYADPAWLEDLAPDLRRGLGNFGGRAQTGPAALPDLAALLQVAPGDLDQLAFAADTLVPGTARCDRLTIQTDFGKAEIPFEQVAAVVGGLHPSFSPGVFLRDGQRLIGTVSCEGLVFELSSGMSVALDVARMDRLVLRKLAEDPTRQRQGWLVETQDGLRVRAAPRAQAFEVATRWGPLDLHLDQVVSIQAADGDSFGMLADLEDGSRFRLYLGADPLSFDTALFGAIELAPWRVAAVVRDRSMRDDSPGSWNRHRDQPAMELAGGDLFVGRLDCDVVRFTQAGSTIPQPPAQLRRLVNGLGGSLPDAGESVRFEAELWGGGRIAGELQELVLPFRTTYGVLHVPVRDIVEVRSPTPLVPEAVRIRVVRLIEQLGDPEWSRRETATTELRELGEMARFALEEALETATSPEVQRRLRRVLELP